MLLNWIVVRSEVTNGEPPVLLMAEHTCGYDEAWILNYKEPSVMRTAKGRRHHRAWRRFANYQCGISSECPAQMLVRDWSPLLNFLAQLARDW